MDNIGDVLLIKDDNDNLIAVDNLGNQIPVSKTTFDSIMVFKSEENINDAIGKLSEKFQNGKEALLLKISVDDIIKFIPDGGENLNIKHFDPKWLSSHVMDVSSFIKGRVREDDKVTVYHAFSEDKINKAQILQEWGINIDSIRESGDLDRMLNYGRSSLLTCYPIIAGVCFPMQTKLSFREKSDGTLALIPHPIRREANLVEYRGYHFTDDDRTNLLTTGNLGHTITIDSKVFGSKSEVYLSLDKETNELVAISKQAIHIPSVIKGVELTESQKQVLESGGAVMVKGLKSSNGTLFNATLQINAEKRNIVFKNPENNLKIGSHLLGKEITDDMRKQWEKGKWIFLEDMNGKDGRKFSAYVRPNKEKGRFEFARNISETEARTVNLVSETQKAIKFIKELEAERKSGADINDEKGNPKVGTKSHAADSILESEARRTKLHINANFLYL